MKQHLVYLQLRFEAPNAIALGSLKWQYIAITATFSSFFLVLLSFLTWLRSRRVLFAADYDEYTHAADSRLPDIAGVPSRTLTPSRR